MERGVIDCAATPPGVPLFKRLVTYATLGCLLITQTVALGDQASHVEGVLHGQGANPAIRGFVDTPNATSVVPNYTTTPPEAAYYGSPNLSSQATSVLVNCALTPTDPGCEAKSGAVTSANTPRPYISPHDADVTLAREIERNPTITLGGVGGFYDSCAVGSVSSPAGTQNRLCNRYSGVGNHTCARTLTVEISRTTSCNPGEWYAHAGSGAYGLDVQCVPEKPESAQHFRVTRSGAQPAFFDVDMTVPLVFPRKVSDPSVNPAVFVVDNSCSGATCSLTGLIAAPRTVCISQPRSPSICTTYQPFLPRYGACPTGQTSGDLIGTLVCNDPARQIGCHTVTLDVSKCYSNTNGTWAVVGDRPEIGWQINPAYPGSIPQMLLTYTKATSTITEVDRWDDACPVLAGGGRCAVATADVCVDGPGMKVIDGVGVTRPCWSFERTLTCSDAAPTDECAPLAAAGCVPSASTCKQTNAVTSVCEIFQDTYQCPVGAQTAATVSSCPPNVFCVQGNCFDISYLNDPDFARSMTHMEAAREAGVYLDTDRLEVFKGEVNKCRDRLFVNCCDTDNAGRGMSNQSMLGGTASRLVFDTLMDSSNRQFLIQGIQALMTGAGFAGTFTTYGVTIAVNGAAIPAGSVVLASNAGGTLVVAVDPFTLAIAVVIAVVLSLAQCSESEGKLALKEGAGLCHEVGTYCSRNTIFGCLEDTTGKCCFNSMLSRIINEQGRVQIGKAWGTGRNPDCSGFTIAQLQTLNFATMDLSEFYASIVPKLPNAAAIQTNNLSRTPTCYFGQGRC